MNRPNRPAKAAAFDAEHMLELRLRRIVTSWPEPLASAFLDYRRSRSRSMPAARTTGKIAFSQPHWLLLPRWLMFLFTGHGRLRLREAQFLNDVLFAQYCLFLAVRTQDDILDGQCGSGSLMFAADVLLLEADRIFAQHFDRSDRFWKYYWQRTNKTFAHIPIVDQLQRGTDPDPEALLSGYAGVNAIFEIGASAVCARYARWRELSGVKEFSRQFSVGSQILDDLADLGEDLRRNRRNYAACILHRCGIAQRTGRANTQSAIRRAIFSGGGIMLINEVERRWAMAFDRLGRLGVREADECWSLCRASLTTMKEGMFRASLSSTISSN